MYKNNAMRQSLLVAHPLTTTRSDWSDTNAATSNHVSTQIQKHTREKILFNQVHDAIQESCIACDAHLASTDSGLRHCFAQDKQKQVSDNTKPQTQ